MKYDPKRHHRRSIRLKGYDYSQFGSYFMTICVFNRECLFGEIIDKKMELNTFGKIVDYKWKNIPEHFKNTKIDKYQIMPNHIHGIIWIFDKKNNFVGAKHSIEQSAKKSDNLEKNASPLQIRLQKQIRPTGTKPGSLSAIMQNYSSTTTRKINQIRKTPGLKLWQRNYYEHIIRNEKELDRIRKYIIENPLKWEQDKENPKNIKEKI